MGFPVGLAASGEARDDPSCEGEAALTQPDEDEDCACKVPFSRSSPRISAAPNSLTGNPPYVGFRLYKALSSEDPSRQVGEAPVLWFLRWFVSSFFWLKSRLYELERRPIGDFRTGLARVQRESDLIQHGLVVCDHEVVHLSSTCIIAKARK